MEWKSALGYSVGNTLKNVEGKYKKLARKAHPDKNPGLGSEPFQALGKALNEAKLFFSRNASPPRPRRSSPPPRRNASPRPQRSSPPPQRRNTTPPPPQRRNASPRHHPEYYRPRRWSAWNNSNNNNWRPPVLAPRTPAAAQTAVPAYRVGLTAQPFRGYAHAPPPRPFVAPRSIIPRTGVRMRPRSQSGSSTRGSSGSSTRGSSGSNSNVQNMNWE